MAGVNIARGEGQKKRAVDVAGPGKPPAAPARPTRWCSHDLKGPLLRSTTQALVVAIRSLPAHWPWPEVDDEAWWQHVLADRRLRRSTAKTLSDEDDAPGQRLDHLPVKSLTFSCAWCGQHATLTVVQLIQMFGRDRNVRSIGPHVVECKKRAARRDGQECPITYQA